MCSIATRPSHRPAHARPHRRNDLAGRAGRHSDATGQQCMASVRLMAVKPHSGWAATPTGPPQHASPTAPCQITQNNRPTHLSVGRQHCVVDQRLVSGEFAGDWEGGGDVGAVPAARAHTTAPATGGPAMAVNQGRLGPMFPCLPLVVPGIHQQQLPSTATEQTSK